MNGFGWLMACLVACLSMSTWAQKVELKAKYEPGTYVMTYSMAGSESTYNKNRTETRGDGRPVYFQERDRVIMTVDMLVGQADDDGNIEVAYTFRTLKKGDWYDSTTDAKTKDVTAMVYNAIIGKSLSVTFDPMGNAGDLKGLDELAAAMAGALPNEVPIKQVMPHAKRFSEYLLDGIGQAAVFPNKPVGKGDTWEISTPVMPKRGTWCLKQVYKLTEIKDGVATVTGTAKRTHKNNPEAEKKAGEISEMNVTIHSTLLIDVATGMVRSATAKHKGMIATSDKIYDTTITFDADVGATIKKSAPEPPAAK